MRVIDSPALKMSADILDDIEQLRIAAEGRYRTLTRSEADADGEIRGLGLTEDHPDVAAARAVLDSISALEAQQVKSLQKIMKRHPFGPWVKANTGIGEKQAARLIAAVGDPYIAERVTKTDDGKIVSVETSPRTLREFLTYAGYGVAEDGQARRRTKGVRMNWNPEAKSRAYLIANSILRAKGPLREVYDVAREKANEATHTVPCRRCGPTGYPAPAGSLLSAGHAHARALRAVSKRVLTDLYNEAKRLHEEEK